MVLHSVYIEDAVESVGLKEHFIDTWTGTALNMCQVKESIIASYTKLVVYSVRVITLHHQCSVCSFGLKEALCITATRVG